jgi:hypothetical protein
VGVRNIIWSRNNSVSIATRLRAGRPGFDFQRGQGTFLFATALRSALGSTQLPIQCVSGALSLGVKWPGREADHSFPSSADVKNAWSYISTLPHVFMGWCLAKYRIRIEKTDLVKHKNTLP